jgi:Flp pilus assembly protein TadD
LEQCLIVDPDNAGVHYNLGVALLQDGSNRDRAKAEFARALALRPGYEEARKALASLR